MVLHKQRVQRGLWNQLIHIHGELHCKAQFTVSEQEHHSGCSLSLSGLDISWRAAPILLPKCMRFCYHLSQNKSHLSPPTLACSLPHCILCFALIVCPPFFCESFMKLEILSGFYLVVCILVLSKSLEQIQPSGCFIKFGDTHSQNEISLHLCFYMYISLYIMYIFLSYMDISWVMNACRIITVSAVASVVILDRFCKPVAQWELVILAYTGSISSRTYSNDLNSTRYQDWNPRPLEK